jgi:hypothetical protein
VRAHPRIHPPVDFLADALNEPFGYRCVVRWPEVAMRPCRSPDFLADAHAA